MGLAIISSHNGIYSRNYIQCELPPDHIIIGEKLSDSDVATHYVVEGPSLPSPAEDGTLLHTESVLLNPNDLKDNRRTWQHDRTASWEFDVHEDALDSAKRFPHHADIYFATAKRHPPRT